MSAKLQEIRRQVAEFLKDAKKLQRLKTDSIDVERFRRMIDRSTYD